MNCILLIDDSKSTNFYHKKLIDICDIAENVQEVYNGLEALDYLEKSLMYLENEKKGYPKPNLVFLDINMPKMDGFEFLEKYKKLSKSFRSNILIIFLTTSNWDKDKARAYENQNLVYDYLVKPLNEEALHKIYNYYINSTCYVKKA